MNYKEPLWKHQVQGIEMARARRDLALFFDMGTGKTRTAIEIIREECAREKVLQRVLILGPLVVVKNWRTEILRFSNIKPQDVVALVGTGKKRLFTFQKETTDPRRGTPTLSRIVIANYEAMDSDDMIEAIKLWSPEILICDESHRLKNHESKRAKRVQTIADICKRRFLLSGTPILNTALDIWQQYRILDGGSTFSLTDPAFEGGRRPMNFYEFRGIYFEDMNAGMPDRPGQRAFAKWMPRQQTYLELEKKIYHKAIRARAEDCIDLPPLLTKRLEIEMGAEQARVYAQVRDECIAWINTKMENLDEVTEGFNAWEKENFELTVEDGYDREAACSQWAARNGFEYESKAVIAQMALTKMLRLQQVVSGFAKTEDGTEVVFEENPRLKALEELLEDVAPAHKVIVWCTFKQNYAMVAAVCKKLKLKYVEIHGEIKDKEKSEKAFRNDEDVRVLIGNQRAGGIGINLVENKDIVKEGQRSYAVFYSGNFSLGDDLQARKRNHRGGATHYAGVYHIDLVAPETVDELRLAAIQEKSEIADLVLGDWRKKL